MSVSRTDWHDFQHFGDGKLDKGEAVSVLGLALEWGALRHKAIDNTSAFAAHSLKVLSAQFPEINGTIGLQPALTRRGGLTTAELLRKAALGAEKPDQE